MVEVAASPLSLQVISDHFNVCEVALRYYFDHVKRGIIKSVRFIGHQPEELDEELSERIQELEKQFSFTILASLEASFYTDYDLRVKLRLKDKLSQSFRELNKEKKKNKKNVYYEDEILAYWKKHHKHNREYKEHISNLIGAINLRNWLAHGRYKDARFGKNYDYFEIYTLAEKIYQDLDLISNT